MKPSSSSPYAGAPAPCVAASARPKPMAASTEGRPGSTHRRITQPSSTASTSGAPMPPASASQRRPFASDAKNPVGALLSVFISAVVPSLSRSLVATQMSPPATGAVATTAAPSSSSACRATRG
jgi:hypothetical protein